MAVPERVGGELRLSAMTAEHHRLLEVSSGRLTLTPRHRQPSEEITTPAHAPVDLHVLEALECRPDVLLGAIQVSSPQLEVGEKVVGPTHPDPVVQLEGEVQPLVQQQLGLTRIPAAHE